MYLIIKETFEICYVETVFIIVRSTSYCHWAKTRIKGLWSLADSQTTECSQLKSEFIWDSNFAIYTLIYTWYHVYKYGLIYNQHEHSKGKNDDVCSLDSAIDHIQLNFKFNNKFSHFVLLRGTYEEII